MEKATRMNAYDMHTEIARMGFSETDAMNRLQSAGVISDHCVWLNDIATVDRKPACKFLMLAKMTKGSDVG